jgi:hypothetical protein
VPAQDRVGRDDGRQLHQRFAADRLALGCQDAPLVICEEDSPPAHLVHERSDLGVLELDDLLLPAVHQSGQNQEEELPGVEDETHGIADTGNGLDLRGNST